MNVRDEGDILERERERAWVLGQKWREKEGHRLGEEEEERK